jgi:hypothetical protein
MTPLTDQIYWASKSPEILAMVAAIKTAAANPESNIYPDDIARGAAMALKLQGRTGQADLVDYAIMVWGYDPTFTMQYRASLGETWEPSALSPPVELLPGLIVPGTPSYSPVSPDPSYIVVSSDAGDYPAYTAPEAVARKGKLKATTPAVTLPAPVKPFLMSEEAEKPSTL